MKRLTRAERVRREQETTARSRTAGGRARTASTGATSPAAAPLQSSARRHVRTTRAGIGSELAERTAWSMLAALAALVGTGLALALAGSIVPTLCPDDDGTCALGWMVVIGMLGYLLALLPACAIGALGIWFWVAYLAGFSPLLVLAAIGDWWWWTSLVLLPVLAAIASAPLGLERIPPWRRWCLLALAAAGVSVVVWWYGFAR